MAAIATAAPARTRKVGLPAGWPVYLLFVGFPIWWFLGLGQFIWPILALPMLFSLLAKPRVRVPRGFGLWLLFLMWMLATAIKLDEPARWIAFFYRVSIYFSATVLLLYVFNTPRRLLPARNVIVTMTIFWMMVVGWGFLGLLAPSLSFGTVTERLIPESLINHPFVRQLVHVRVAKSSNFLGYPVPRPNAPFLYSNEWGANFALLTPFLLAGWSAIRGAIWKWLTRIMLLVAVVPVIVSLNRGLWLSLGLGLVYAAFRFAQRGKVRALGGIVLLLGVVSAVVLFSPMRQILDDRLATGHSNNTRINLYQEALDGAMESPLFGFGSPRPSEKVSANPNQPSVGTQGQFWLVLFSHGFPGAILFCAWWFYMWWRSRRHLSTTLLWFHVVLFIALLQLPYYGMLPAQIHVVMVAAALYWREIEAQPTYSFEAPRERPAAARLEMAAQPS